MTSVYLQSVVLEKRKRMNKVFPDPSRMNEALLSSFPETEEGYTDILGSR